VRQINFGHHTDISMTVDCGEAKKDSQCAILVALESCLRKHNSLEVNHKSICDNEPGLIRVGTCGFDLSGY
jgi:hypothetical protein